MIKNIIFDMVGVVLRFDTEGYCRDHGFTEEDRRIIKREVFGSLEWARQDRGTITDDDAIAAICARTPEHLHKAVRDFILRENRAILSTEGMETLLAQLKELGYRLFLLSNTCTRQHVFWPSVPESRYFDDTLISADVGLVKPQPEIFRLACEQFRIDPVETAYIDDSPMNAEAAYFIGMHAFVFHDDMTELRVWLEGLGCPIMPHIPAVCCS